MNIFVSLKTLAFFAIRHFYGDLEIFKPGKLDMYLSSTHCVMLYVACEPCLFCPLRILPVAPEEDEETGAGAAVGQVSVPRSSL